MAKNRNKAKQVADTPQETGAVAVVETPVAEKVAATVPTQPKLSTIGEDSKPIRSRTNRQTGTRINSYAPSEPGASWIVTCTVHGTVKHYGSRKAGKATVYTPASWCDGCAAVLAEKQAAAKAKADEALAKAAAESAPVASQ
jgi:hypothetical protein